MKKLTFQIKENQLKQIIFEIELSELQQHFNTFFKSFGEIEHVSVSITTNENSSNFKLKLKDNLRKIVISL